MNGDTLIAAARVAATIAHAGQTDKSGQPYIGHPERVAELVGYRWSQDGHGSKAHYIAAAWLHDVVEDTNVGFNDLRDMGFTAPVVAAVKLLTRPEEERYEGQYYQNIKTDATYGHDGAGIALLVKLADVADNTDPRRLAKLDEKTQLRLIKKYANALEKLS